MSWPLDWVISAIGCLLADPLQQSPLSIEAFTSVAMLHPSAIHVVILIITSMFAFSGTERVYGQVLPAVTSSLAQQADDTSASSDVDVVLDATSNAGSLTYVADHWGEFHLTMENQGNSPRELLCTSYFEDATALQFGRKVWLPAHSRLSLPHPALIPEADRFPDGRGTVYTLVIDQSQGGEIAIQSRSGLRLRERDLLISTDDRHTGIVTGWESTDVVPQEVVDLVVACRVYQGLNNKVTFVAGQFLPADETNIAYLDHLVLADDRLVDDLAGLTAVRRWVHAGGRLWILLDRTGPAILERLFGDEFEGSVVDQTELTAVTIESPQSTNIAEVKSVQTNEYDEPIGFSRAVVTGMTVRNSVAGWPAALTTTFGEGRVLVTTLGPRAWIKPSPPFRRQEIPDDETAEQKIAREQRELEMKTAYVPVAQMEDVAPFIFARRDPQPLPSEELAKFAQEFISYEVPSGSLIIGAMFGFLALLAIVGVGLWKLERLEHFGWCGSLLAVILGSVFLWAGLSNRHRTSETIASVQLAQAIKGTDDVRTRSAAEVYRVEEDTSQIGTSLGGKILPRTVGGEGANSRMVTTDLGTFSWQGLKQPPGLSTYHITTSRSNPHPLEASATVDAQGVVGECGEQLSSGADLLLVTRRGRMGVKTSASGEFTASADTVLEPDQFLDVSYVDDVSDRRQRILKQLFSNQQWQNSLDEPHLLLWLNDWQTGFHFGEGLEREGDTLMTVPLKLEQPPPGTEVVIPSPLLDYLTRQPPDGSTSSGFWDDGNQEWQERSNPSTTWLGVQVPKAFLPLDVNEVIIEINVSGLMGQIEILGVNNGSIVSLENVSDPVGTVEIEINDADALTVSTSGELLLGLSAGVVPDSEASRANSAGNSWQVHSLSVQIRGITKGSTQEKTDE